MTTIVIATTTLAADKIVGITHCTGKLLVDVGTAEPLSWSDPDRTLLSRALQDWKDYLADRQSRWQEAIQYGVVLAADRGSLS